MLNLTRAHSGHTLYAATAGDLPASCRAKRAVINYASERKRGISGLLSAIFSILYFRMWLRQRREERESTADLVAIALDKLQEQVCPPLPVDVLTSTNILHRWRSTTKIRP
jgi:hypothetical protein